MARSGIEGAADDVQKLAKNKGSLEGEKNVKIYDRPGPSGRIEVTDLDHIENGVLWEDKTAVSAGNPNIPGDLGDPVAWTDKQVTKKFNSYLDARANGYLEDGSPIPAEYRNAPIGIRMNTPGVEPGLRTAIETAVDAFRAAHPDVTILLEFK
jgi:hypothetical protein